MTVPVLFTAAFLLLASAPQANMPGIQRGTLRNTFVTAAETVVDNAAAIDPAAPDAQYAPQLRQLKQSQENLKSMAAGDREQEIAEESNNLIFTVSACHLQALEDASKAVTCKPQIDHAIQAVMTLLDRHKSNGVWVEGPPS